MTAPERTNDRARRVRKAAWFVLASGDAPRSRELLEELIAQLPPSEERARALTLLASIANDPLHAIALLDDALAQTDDLELRSSMLSQLCWAEIMRDRWDAAARHARQAVELAERSGSRGTLAQSLGRLTWSELGPARLQTIERAVELERSLSEQLPGVLSPSYVHGMLHFALDRIDEARRQFEDEYERALAVGDWFQSINLAWLAEVELRAGNWDKARAHARATRLAPSGLITAEAWGAACSAVVEAHLGNEDAAVPAGEYVSRHVRAGGIHLSIPQRVRPRASAALSGRCEGRGRPSAAPGRDGRGRQPVAGVRDAHALERHRGACRSRRARTGPVRRRPARRACPFDGRAVRDCRGGPLPGPCARPRRDVGAARASIKRAPSEHARLHEPFELARTYLAQGSIERRAKRKAEARVALGRAEAIFDELGARLWL